jgi:hypothetical protein
MDENRISVIEHGIVLQDFSRLQSAVDALAVVAQARAFMARRPPTQSTLVLTDVTGSTFNQEVVDAMRGLAEHHRPYVKASVLVGLTPIMRVLYRAVVALTRRNIVVAESREKAIAILRAA